MEHEQIRHSSAKYQQVLADRNDLFDVYPEASKRGWPSLAKGGGLKIRSRRGSRVQILPLALPSGSCFARQSESALAFQASVCHAKSEFSLGDNSRGCRAPRLFWNTGPIWSGPLLFSNRLRGVESLAWLFRMNSLVDEICLGEFGECMSDRSGGE